MIRAWRIVSVIALGGCASTMNATRKSGDGWLELRTPHFVLRTDLEAEEARNAALALEATRDELLAAAWPEAHLENVTRADVFVLARKLSFNDYFPKHVGGAFHNGQPPAFFLFGSPESWENGRGALEGYWLLRHELTHQLESALYPRRPRWFAEGLAVFLETVHYSEDKRSVVIGAVNVRAWEDYLYSRSVYVDSRSISLRRLLAWGEGEHVDLEREGAGFYGASWILVHWLYNTRPQPFARFQIELARGTEPHRAWEAAFPDFDLDQAEREINSYARQGKYTELLAPARLSNPTIQERMLAPAEVHAVRAEIALVGSLQWKDGTAQIAAAKKEVVEALRVDPTNVRALRLEQWADPAERLPRVRRATGVHADDPLGWDLLASLSWRLDPKGSESEEAWRRALALDPESPWVLNALAWKLVETDRPLEALPLAIKAMNRAPSNAAVADTYARALFLLGRCKAAIEAQTKAVGRLGDAERAHKHGDRFKKRLAEYQASCGQSAD